MFAAAVAAADPARALAGALRNAPFPLRIDGRFRVVAVGKAACAMAEEAIRHLPEGEDFSALAVTNYENVRQVGGCRVVGAGHPVPDTGGLRGGQAIMELLKAADAGDLVVALISGGASALAPAPVEGISLQDKAEVSRVLLGAGFDIAEMNLVRQHLSHLKGGGMARLAAPAPIRAFILSDVIGDDLRVIASGPTAAPVGSRGEALELLRRRDVLRKLPEAVRAHLQRPGAPPGPDRTANVENTLIGSNRQSIAAALASAAFPARIVSDRLTGDVEDAAREILGAAMVAPRSATTALVFGGETTVRLRGKGRGGRNQELALRFARLAGKAGLRGGWVFLSGGTDGRDGPTEAAGGIVDPATLDRIRAAGKDPEALLADNDSYAALDAAGDLLVTGPTGTNVADVQILVLDAAD